MKLKKDVKKLGEILLEKNLISQEDLIQALNLSYNSPLKFGQLLVKKGLIQEEAILEALSEQTGIPYEVSIKLQNIEEIFKKVPKHFLKKHKILPYKLENGTLYVAVSDPMNIKPLDDIRIILGIKNIKPVIASEKEILNIIDTQYDKIISGELKVSDIIVEDKKELEISEEELLLDDSDAPAIRFVRSLLEEAVESRASDIHIEPQEKETIVRFRIDGILHEIVRQPKSLHNAIVSRIKVIANLNIAETRIPQDGRIKRKILGNEIDIRVSTMPTYFGEKVVLRLLNKTGLNFTLENIGFEEDILEKYKKLLKHTEGMIIITGPTGSGKSTTLYASLLHINTPQKNIMTIEDPVEYQIEGVNHIQVKPSIGFTFANGLRAILRQDPDIIMIGEIRDVETARVAIQAALTGHLVLTTLHTNDAPSAITRLLDMGIEPYLVTASLKGIVAQRLVRTICPNCKKNYKATKEEIEELKPILKNSSKSITLKKGKGCKKCKNTGYMGRTAIYELLTIDDEIRKAIISNKDASKIKEIAIKKGMRTLKEDGLLKVLKGITTIEEVLRVTFV